MTQPMQIGETSREPLDELPSLAAQTSAFYEQYLRKEKPAVVQLKSECQNALSASGIGRACLQAGDRMPRFTLPNLAGQAVDSSALLARGPLVISFYRGSWCGFCNLEMRALQEALPFIREAGAELVAISPDVSDGPAEVVDTYGFAFELLTDRGNRVARQFGLAYSLDERLRPLYKNEFGIDIGHYSGEDSWDLPITATYVVDSEGLIVEAFTDPDHTHRMEPRTIVETLRALKDARVQR